MFRKKILFLARVVGEVEELKLWEYGEFKRKFFIEGVGSSYRGIWMGDGGKLSELPFEDSAYHLKASSGRRQAIGLGGWARRLGSEAGLGGWARMICN
jgi:hypothetical protein